MQKIRKTRGASPFHPCELAVQDRVGVREAIEPWARQAVRPFLLEEHRAFFRQLPFIVVAARDATGRPWVTLLTGRPGFIDSPNPSSLQIAADLLSGDALEGAMTSGADLGLLGIELDTRRRNRANGTIRSAGSAGFTFKVAQSFGNCPQYITERRWHQVDPCPSNCSAARFHRLTAGMQEWITAADTVFIGSGYRGRGEHAAYGMDASHRGGAPGFIKVLDSGRLVLPDYAGNNFFNTLGNLVADSRVALLFVDFEKGSLLQISGTATIDWESVNVANFPGAQRTITVDIEQVVHLHGALPLRWETLTESPRPLRLIKKTVESANVTSFEFAAVDIGELSAFRAGQYLPIEVHLTGHAHPLTRTYSLSNAPGQGIYRISVKREPHGAVSRYLHDELVEGDLVNGFKPSGGFVLQDSDRAVALISAGVGVTPMVSMLHALVQEKGLQPVYFIHGVRNGSHHPLREEVLSIARRHKHVHPFSVYSQPNKMDIKGSHYDRHGHISIDLLKELIPALDADFYVCGPSEFLASLVVALHEHGVMLERIRTESF